MWQMGASPGDISTTMNGTIFMQEYFVNMGSHRFSCHLALGNVSCFMHAVVKLISKFSDPDKHEF